MQTQPATTISATTTAEEIKPIISTPPALPVQPNYTVTIDDSSKKLDNEQEAILTQNISESNTQVQTASQVNFASTTGGYTSVSAVPHMFSNQPPTNFTPGKYN